MIRLIYCFDEMEGNVWSGNYLTIKGNIGLLRGLKRILTLQTHNTEYTLIQLHMTLNQR